MAPRDSANAATAIPPRPSRPGPSTHLLDTLPARRSSDLSGAPAPFPLDAFRQYPAEVERARCILGLLPAQTGSILDVGAREGHFSRLFTTRFHPVVALDLVQPEWSYPGVTTLRGDVTALDFPDRAFDYTFCSEVLEHVPRLSDACRELQRVTLRSLIIGVPFRQDIRLGRTTCPACRAANPPWGHVNSFSLERLQCLFPEFAPARVAYAGQTRAVTNPLSTLLMDRAGNPWGAYNQQEPCIHCGATIDPPPVRRALPSRAASGLAHCLNSLQQRFTSPRPNWIHIRFERRPLS